MVLYYDQFEELNSDNEVILEEKNNESMDESRVYVSYEKRGDIATSDINIIEEQQKMTKKRNLFK